MLTIDEFLLWRFNVQIAIIKRSLVRDSLINVKFEEIFLMTAVTTSTVITMQEIKCIITANYIVIICYCALGGTNVKKQIRL